MNSIDIVLGILLLYAFYKGFKNGLIVEIASIIALIAGVFCAIYFSDITAAFLMEKFDWNEKYVSISSFIITFSVVLIGVQLLGKLLTKIAKAILLGTINKVLGGVFGALKALLILGIILVFIDTKLDFNQWVYSHQMEESILFSIAQTVGSFFYQFLFSSDVVERVNEIV